MRTRTVWIDGTIRIDIPVTDTRTRIGSNAPHYQVLGHRLKQVALDVGALKMMLDGLNPSSILDMLGGCGFSGAVLRNSFPKASLFLNDIDPVCAEVLKHNFPDAVVSQLDILKWEDFPKTDLIWIDFNNFTLKRFPTWGPILIRAASRSRTLLFTDSACYGFKMGNLKTYGVERPIEYYRALGQALADTGKHVRRVVMFGGAALVRMEMEPGPILLEDQVIPAKVTQHVPYSTGLFG